VLFCFVVLYYFEMGCDVCCRFVLPHAFFFLCMCFFFVVFISCWLLRCFLGCGGLFRMGWLFRFVLCCVKLCCVKL
jgi:hypothetical protein